MLAASGAAKTGPATDHDRLTGAFAGSPADEDLIARSATMRQAEHPDLPQTVGKHDQP
jgi:hypothetical protein